MTDRILYRSGYKYQLAVEYRFQLSVIRPLEQVELDFLELFMDGLLIIKAGYAWDGATGVPDRGDIVRGSLVHDALYQLMREGYLDPVKHRVSADVVLQEICIADGMPEPFAELVYQAVQLLGSPAADPKHKQLAIYAPPDPVVVVVIDSREAP